MTKFKIYKIVFGAISLLMILFVNTVVHSQIISTFPYSESFETSLNSGFGNWNQVVEIPSGFNWTRNTGPTPTPNTGPASAQSGDYYLYIEADGNFNRTAAIEADVNFSGVTQPILQFNYHRYGVRVGHLRLDLSIDGGNTWNYDYWNTISDNINSDQWNKVTICLDQLANKSNVKLRFRALTQDTTTSDIAIDNIKIIDFKITSINTVNATCASYSNGSINVNISGGYSPYYYSIDDGFSFVEDASLYHLFDSLPSTDYPVVVKDSVGCDVSGGIIHLTEPTSINVSFTKNNVEPCFYDSTGSIAITAFPLIHTPLQFSIDSGLNYSYSNSFINLPKDTFYIRVKNSLGCLTPFKEVIIGGPQDIFFTDIDTIHVETCYGNPVGSINVVAAGGTPPLEYSIDGSNYETGGYFHSLSGDYSYQVTVKDTRGCSKTTGYIFIQQPEELILNSVISQDVTGCFGNANGSITINVTGGTQPIYYSIDNESSYSTSNLFSNLTIGIRNIIIKDANGCSISAEEDTITQPPLLKILNVDKVNVNGCNGNSNGEIFINSSGGTAPFLYSIDNGVTFQSSNTFTDLNIGTYYPYVKDANECFDTDPSFSLIQPTSLEINSVNTVNISTCMGGNNGMIQIFASEGTPQYQYSIDGGGNFSTYNSFTNLTAGEYQIVVKDYYNCSVNGGVYTLTEPTQIFITEQNNDNESCNGGIDAFIFVNANGGTGQLNYSVDNGNNFPFICGTYSFHLAGTYNIVVRDDNGCFVQGTTLTITEPDELIINSVDTVGVTGCYGENNGSITFDVTGGTLPYQYSIDGGFNLQESNIFANLEAGIDFVPYVKDYNGCFKYSNAVMITEPDSLFVVSDEHTNIKACNGSATGTVTVVARGGTDPLFYSIDDGITYFENNGLFTGLTAGTYNIKVKDFNNCVTSGFYEIITQPTVMNFDNIITNDIICYGQSNGKLQIFASGGQLPLRYSINGGIDTLQAFQFIGLYPGTYDIEVYDFYGCTIDTFAVINEPDTLMITNVQHTDISSCYGNNEGTISVSATGGVPSLLYSYAKLPNPLMPFSPTTSYTNLPSGIYYVAVIDQNECMRTSDVFNITSPNPISLSTWTKKDISCFGQTDGEIHLTSTGGTGNHLYTIDNGLTWTNSGGNYLNMPAGTYVCGVKDENGCVNPSNFKTLIINEPVELAFENVLAYDITCYNANDGGIVIYGIGGSQPYQFALNAGNYQLNRTFTNLLPGTYVPYLKDLNGCSIIGEEITFTNPQKYSTFTVDIDTGCAPLSVKFTPDHFEANFEWFFGDGETSINTSPTHIFTNTGSLTLQYTTKGIAYYQGCKDTSEILITIRPLPYLDFIVDEELKYYPDTIFYITNLSQSGFTNYLWDFGDGQTFTSPNPDLHSYTTCGDYTIQMSASNEFCSDTVFTDVSVTAVAPGANFSIDNNKGCVPLKVKFVNQTSGGVTYNWNFDNGINSSVSDTTLTYEAAGDYIVNLTAYGYCNTSTTFTKEINIYDNPIVNFNIQPDTVVIQQPVRYLEDCIFTDSYFWMFGDGDVSIEKAPIHAYSLPGLYDVTLIGTSANGCKDTLMIKNAVEVADDPFVIFPTAFTPNGDTHNDYFIPIYGQITDARLYIFDRYGKMVFRTYDLSDYWDGRSLSGEYCQPGVYVWKVEGRYLSGSVFTDTGNVTLLR